MLLLQTSILLLVASALLTGYNIAHLVHDWRDRRQHTPVELLFHHGVRCDGHMPGDEADWDACPDAVVEDTSRPPT